MPLLWIRHDSYQRVWENNRGDSNSSWRSEWIRFTCSFWPGLFSSIQQPPPADRENPPTSRRVAHGGAESFPLGVFGQGTLSITLLPPPGQGPQPLREHDTCYAGNRYIVHLNDALNAEAAAQDEAAAAQNEGPWSFFFRKIFG